MKIAVIGDYILDQYVFGTVERISPESPIPIFKEISLKDCPGGSGNVAANLKALGVEVLHYHDGLCHPIKKRYVCDNHIMFRADVEEYYINSWWNFDLKDVEYCILSDYNKGYLHYSKEIIKYCQAQGCTVVVDPKKHLSNYHGADYVKLNQKEIKEYTDGETYSEILEKYDIGALIITQGQNGVYVHSRDFQGQIPCDKHQVSDVTGAGDVFIAVMTYHLARRESLVNACTKANKLASLSVTKFGTYVITEDDIKQTKTIFTNGCFDILHRGHVDYLKRSKQLGARLIVGLNSDESVKRLKGEGRPINTQDDRKAILESLDCVDEVIVFDEDTPYELIKKIKPDIITKGGDYKSHEVVGNDLAEVVIIPLVDGLSTTNIIEKIR